MEGEGERKEMDSSMKKERERDWKKRWSKGEGNKTRKGQRWRENKSERTGCSRMGCHSFICRAVIGQHS